MVRRYRSGWWLERKYRDEGLTQREIAEVCGVSPSTIRNWMKHFGIPRRDIEGENHPLYGQARDEAVREQISETMSDRTITEEWRNRIADARRGRKLPAETREKISDSLTGLIRSEETRTKMSESTTGEQNPNWRGGHNRRYGSGWAVARERVLERDGVCQNCGHDGSDRRLHVHHIIPVRLFREASNVDLESAHVERNLELLCSRCHARADHGRLEFDLLPILEAVFLDSSE